MRFSKPDIERVPPPMTEPPRPPSGALWPPVERQPPAPERVEYAGTLAHETGPMHATAIRATALTAAVTALAGEVVPVDQICTLAAQLADYIETGERPT